MTIWRSEQYEREYTSARYTIVSKATSDEEDRSALLTTVLEPIFAPKQKKAV